ncbi:protein FAR1-RELATED SEQUENCE 11-like [Wolffia australiana]
MKGAEVGVATISEDTSAGTRVLDIAPVDESSIARAWPASSSGVPSTHKVSIGDVFETLDQAREKCTEYANCPLGQKSSKHLKFIRFLCFHGGQASTKQFSVSTEIQREKRTLKCQCPFVIKLWLNQASGVYEVYHMNNQHNHDLFTEAELAQMPQNRFIPDKVKTKMLELNELGMLSCSQIKTLIEQEHFPDVPVTWTIRDIQNLLQKSYSRACETNDFVKLLKEKSNHGWSFNFQLNDDTLRLERVFWISPNGKEKYVQFNDVLEIDTTNKTNRFGMPLVLFTVIDNHGLTVLTAGCLLSNEQFESYTWALQQFRSYTNLDPIVLFTDGDMELARAIKDIWPNAIHLLCRFHISQNITRALASSLRANLSEFMTEFWRVGSIEDVDEFEMEFSTLKSKWQAVESYLRVLEGKKKQWAFAYTHNNFVAGVSSTQRQEMVNCQIKSTLLSNLSLLRIIDGFDAVETRSREKLSQARLSTNFAAASMDPLINDALHILTNYAQVLLKAKSGMSLSYTCVADDSKDEGYFLISHKDFPNKFRVVRISIGFVEQSTCSCRKAIWLGIVCRHMLCCFCHNNILSCPVSMFNRRWKKVCETVDIQSIFIDTALATRPNSEFRATQGMTEDQRLSELTALTKPILHRSIGSESTFQFYKASLIVLGETIEINLQTLHRALSDLEEEIVRNPLTARCKGRPKIGNKRYISMAEQLQSKKKQRGVTCSSCRQHGHNARTCKTV